MISRIARTTIYLPSKGARLTAASRWSFSEKDDRFLRFIDLDARYLSQVPYIFKPLQPAISLVKESIVQFNSLVGLPWWVIIFLSSLFIRITIFPLILIQMKKMSRLGPVWPLLAYIKETWRKSELPAKERMMAAARLYRYLAHSQNFRMRSVFVYNLAYYPILITMVYSLRSLLSIQEVSHSGFLYLSNFADIDPYYILPTLTVAAYYWNFERFITKENKSTIMSKIRSACQILLIIWYPFLCCWPSGIVLYMFCNSLVSIAQGSLMKSLWFNSKINPKITHYNMILSKAEYDKGTSASIVEAIKTGEDSWKEKAIKEQLLVGQTLNMLQKLNIHMQEQRKAEEKKMKRAPTQQKKVQIENFSQPLKKPEPKPIARTPKPEQPKRYAKSEPITSKRPPKQ